MEKILSKFISKHHVMTIATIGEGGTPRTANLFYAYDTDNDAFIFTSSLSTAHGSDMCSRPFVGANIVLESSNIGSLEGLQIEGIARRPESDSELSRIKKIYLKRFPFAIALELELWSLSVDFMKMTDNKLGFGKKIIWKREQK